MKRKIADYHLIILVVLTQVWKIQGIPKVQEFQRFDGWYNNLAHPNWGAVGTRLYRMVPSYYTDGVYMIESYDRPSAREISDLVFKGPDGIRSQRNITTMLAFFSQVVAYEILQSSTPSCPLEMHKIPIPKCDPVFDDQCSGETMMPFTRAKYDKATGAGLNSPREQINERTSWIDASFLYSTQEPWVSAMRSYVNGTLREGPMRGYPPFNSERTPLINPPPPQIHRLMNPERLFLLGDPRINENPGLLSLGLLLYRWHNRLAQRLQRQNPQWSDQSIFDGARRYVIATLQNIVMYQFLPALLNEPDPLGPYEYQPDLPPGISHVFSAAAFRFPHTMVPSGMLLRKAQPSNTCTFRNDVAGYPAVRLCQNWWNAQDVVTEYSVEEIILGMASQIAEAEDSIVVSDLRDYLFGPMHFSRMDLAALGIMRGRDNGLASYSKVRQYMGLPAKNWTTLNPKLANEQPELISKLRELYHDSIDHLDMYVGGMLEAEGNGPGETFKAIIRNQFVRIRNADRFWFENRQNEFFTDAEIAEIRNITLRDIILQTTQIEEDQLQSNVFFWKDGDPCEQPKQISSEELESCAPFVRFDHFMGNEVVYIFTCIALGIIPIACAGIGYLIIRKKRKGMADVALFANLYPLNNKVSTRNFSQNGYATKAWKLTAIEWLHENYCRTVVVLVGPQQTIRIENLREGLLREIDLDTTATLIATIADSNSKRTSPFILISLPNEYDLVLRFQCFADSRNFLLEVERVMKKNGKHIKVRQVRSDEKLLGSAETREKRQQKLEHFFRKACAEAFIEPALHDDSVEFPDNSEAILSTTLTRTEFAEALGMAEGDIFIERMFSCVAQTYQDKISFQEFLGTVRKFSLGTAADKLQVLFDMCDRNKTGRVDREEFVSLLRSINLAVGVAVDDEGQRNLVNCLLSRAGVSKSSSVIDRKDFDDLVNNITAAGRPVGLHLRGRGHKVSLQESDSLNSFAIPQPVPTQDCGGLNTKLIALSSSLEDYRQHYVWLFLFFAFAFGFFLERYWHYSQETEHRDLRRVMGTGIAWTRGAAAGLSFCFAVIPLTVCRNVITKLRETVINDYVPFDAAITFHKIVAITGCVFAVIHTVGHCINFYHIATQSPEGLKCLFQEAVFSSDFQPSINYWLFGTVTGITGILLVVVMSVIYVFAAPSVINKAYHAFRFTHFLNILLYALTVAHGLPKLLDKPRFWCFVIFPVITFVIDRILTMRAEYRKLEIITAVLLPSDVCHIQCKRPRNFHFRSGQWVRVACPAFNCQFNEKHAFSVASAPQDPTLELYIKAVGPWTWQLRNGIQQSLLAASDFPTLNIDGPYGGGAQNWYNYEVAVLVGGGIGVSPYASVLKDVVQSTSSDKHSDALCKKVYFVWVCSSHKNFEFFVDVLRQVEEEDRTGILETHIFVTQFFHKFDLRTTMLYICEQQFRRERGRSMFTNLRATNHFGRPNMQLFMQHIQDKHMEQSKIGVFSCGPASLNSSVRSAVNGSNRNRSRPHFIHRFETF